jgi:thioredoxin-related protein
MFKTLGLALFLSLFGLCVFSEDAVETVHLEVSNYEEALAVARDEGRRVYLLFKGENCHWCDKQSLEMEKPEYARAMDGLVFCVVDVAERRDIAARYRVSLVPSHRVIDAEGNVLRSSTGYMDAAKASLFLEP